METIQMLGNLGEFVGAFAVVATLIYLTIQVRHSRDAMEENSRLARAAVIGTTFDHISQFRRHIIDNADVVRIWRQGCAAEQELSEDDWTRFEQLAQEFVFGLTSVFGQAVAARNEDFARSMPSALARRVHDEPGLRAIWEKMVKGLTAEGGSSFVEAVDIALVSLQREGKAKE